jgi:hypothetical protein
LLYSIGKRAVESAASQMFTMGKNITLIKPGYINIDSASHVNVPKLNPLHIAELVEEILKKPYRTKAITLVQE